MTSGSQRQTLLETIVMLAEEIGRASPESADKAMRIVKLVRELDAAPDQATIQDAIETETLDSDLSDTQVHNTATAVVKALRDER